MKVSCRLIIHFGWSDVLNGKQDACTSSGTAYLQRWLSEDTARQRDGL
jgi:hypothetical protein